MKVARETPPTREKVMRDEESVIHFANIPEDIGGSGSVDRDPVPYQAVSAVAHAAFLLLCMSLPGTVSTLQADDTVSGENRFVDLMRKPQQKENSGDEPDWVESGSEESGSRQKRKEGKAGKKEVEERDRKMAEKGPPDQEETKMKKRAEKVAMEAGIAKSLNEPKIASKWGSERAIGDDAVRAVGNLDGRREGESRGFGGLGLEDGGRGGGGDVADSGVGIGAVGDGIGDEPPGDGTVAGEEPNLGENSQTDPEVYSPPPEVTGALDRETVRKVVRRHRREIKYCYEKQLQRNPSLAGEVNVEFTISGNGEVIAAFVTESNLGSAAVEQCMQRKIRNWVFPNPKRGKVVKVSYPFNFSSGGS
jgi:TonB family protein